jgi:hypothetical protein
VLKQPDLQEVLRCAAYIVECQQGGKGVTAHTGWLNGEVDWVEELYRLTKGVENVKSADAS